MEWAVTLLALSIIWICINTWRLSVRLDRLQRRLGRLISDLAVVERGHESRDGPGLGAPMTKA